MKYLLPLVSILLTAVILTPVPSSRIPPIIKENMRIHRYNATNPIPDYLLRDKKGIAQRLYAEIPAIREKNISDFERVNKIREWVFENIPHVRKPKLLLESIKNVSSSVDVPFGHRLHYYFSGEAGAWCSATASILMDIYNLFGYTAFEVGYGYSSMNDNLNASHNVTLVRITHKGQEILTLQDAYLNLTYTFTNKEPMDYLVLLKLVKVRRADDVLVLKGKEELKPLLVNNLFEYLSNPRLSSYPEKILPNGKILTRELFEINLNWFYTKSVRFLRTKGYPEDLIYLLPFPFGMFSATDQKEAAEILQQAQSL